MSEANLRDLLSERLALLEPGLTLIDTEFILPNDVGAKGFVDILTRDQHGHLVIIELKISNASARSAIHEVFKYVTLVRTVSGLPERKIRCIIVSTEWHELLVPFSAYKRCVRYSVEGLRLCMESGQPSRVERVVPVPEPEDLDLCPCADLLLYGIYGDNGPTQRDAALRELQTRAAELGIEDYCLTTFDNPNNAGYAATSAIGVSIARLTPDKAGKHAQHPDFDLELFREEDADEYDWAHEQATLALWVRGVFRSDMELLDSPKIVRMLKDEGWTMGRIIRGGRLSSEAITPDDELRSRLLGLDGSSWLSYSSSSSPRLDASWDHFVAAAGRCLRGNNAWLDGWTLYLKRLQEELREAAVSTYIFNPQNIAFILWEFACGNGSNDILPSLQVAIELDGHPVRLLVGQLEWDGVTRPDDPQRLFSGVFERASDMEGIPFSVRGLYLCRMFGGLSQLDAALVAAHGLSYGLT